MFSINPLQEIKERDSLLNLHSTMFSINRMADGGSRSGKSHLHSTMFSINLFSCFGLRSVSVIYIPLCFLLIPPLNNTPILLLLQPHIVDPLFEIPNSESHFLIFS